jgi:regulator of sigma E protease
MSVFVMIAQLILGLALLVFVHELGHFFAARVFKIRVPKFYLFFNPGISLVRCKKVDGKLRFKFFAKNTADTVVERDENGEPVLDEKGKPKHKLIDVNALPEGDWRKYPENTEYGIGWLPLGGYCQISGMIDETQSIENMASEPQAWEYRSKPAWQRLIVILGGVIVNLVVGVLLFALVIGKYEKQYLPNAAVTDGIYAYEAARNMGFQIGDKIVSINGKKPERFKDAINPIMYFGSIVTVERAGKSMDIVISEDAYNVFKKAKKNLIQWSNFPVIADSIIENKAADLAGIQKGDRILSINDTLEIASWGAWLENIHNFNKQEISINCLRGEDTVRFEVTPDSLGEIGLKISPIPPYQFTNYTFGESIKYGWKDAMNSLLLNIKGLGKVISGKENARESLTGPIGIAQIYGKEWDWRRFWSITGLLSIVLAFMNVLPFPGLDGGHAVFAFIEMLPGRKVSDKVLQHAQTIGMIILLLLMAFVIGNDIFKLFM